MLKKMWPICPAAVFVSAALLFAPRYLCGQTPMRVEEDCSGGRQPGAAEYVVTQEDEDLATSVLQRMAAMENPAGMPWPPMLRIANSTEVNACAFIGAGPDGKAHSFVTLHTALLRKVIRGNGAGLAFVMGHELAHHLLGHTQKSAPPTSFLAATFSRDQELAADKYGMLWGLKAGYSYDDSLNAIMRIREQLGDYSPLQALRADHPSWTERLEMLDKEQASLWRAMSAFDSGVYFLETEQYLLAERCFRSVTKQFPQSYEAWTDLGYALLMQYADALDVNDLRRFGVGQIVAGGFYRRPKNLEPTVRGIHEDIWWEAVGALRESIRRKPDQATSYANLGIAYLLRPAGTDAANATKYLERAEELATSDTSLDASSRAALMINLAVAYSASGSYDKFDKTVREAQSVDGTFEGQEPGTSSVSRAITYNHAMRFAGSQQAKDQRVAVEELEGYLTKSSPDSSWWDLAYDRYTQLCGTLSISPKSAPDFKSRSKSEAVITYRPVSVLQISANVNVTLGEALQEVKAQLGEGFAFPAVPSTNLMRVKYDGTGIELLANEIVLAIIITTNQHLVPVQQTGLGAKRTAVQVGMSSADLDNILPYADLAPILDPEQTYRWYSQLGLAAKIRNGKVAELVIVQIPRSGA